MTTAALFVDLPNFYSELLRSNIEERGFLKDYFLNWLDLDILAAKLTEEKTKSFSGIWVFYSGGRIGPSSERIKGDSLKDCISRINALEGVTARDVNIPGEQREPVPYKCKKCKHEGMSESISEKGIDASLTVHLYDTMDSWDVAYLLSGDADFVPAVASLRRRGKIVIGAGFSSASSALVRECYNYIDLCGAFLREDVAMYTFFKKNGIAEKWLTDDVHCEPGGVPSDSVELTLWWTIHRTRLRDDEYFATGPISFCNINLAAKGSIDLSDRCQLITEFQTKFPNQVEIPSKMGYRCRISLSAWESVKRRLQTFTSSIKGLKVTKLLDSETYERQYQYNADKNRYDLIID